MTISRQNMRAPTGIPKELSFPLALRSAGRSWHLSGMYGGFVTHSRLHIPCSQLNLLTCELALRAIVGLVNSFPIWISFDLEGLLWPFAAGLRFFLAHRMLPIVLVQAAEAPVANSFEGLARSIQNRLLTRRLRHPLYDRVHILRRIFQGI